MQAVANAWQLNLAQMRFLNLYAVAEDLAATYPDITVGWAESYGHDCVRQAVRWFLEKFNVQLYDTTRAFKAARLMCPSTLRSLAPTAATVQQLRIFPFLNDDSIINDLCAELPQYFAAAEDTSFDGDNIKDVAARKVHGWRDHEAALPHWASAVKKVFLVQPF